MGKLHVLICEELRLEVLVYLTVVLMEYMQVMLEDYHLPESSLANNCR